MHCFKRAAPKSITQQNFKVVTGTWGTSKVDEVGIAWIAIGKPKQ